jgi:pyruvate/2-oxoglutarate dehydrogenase complex dihydrolipoamide acyltransferase (E2) component
MLGIGTTAKRVVVQDDDSTAVKQVTSFSLTHNHTLMDGYHLGIVIDMLKKRLDDPRPFMGLEK